MQVDFQTTLMTVDATFKLKLESIKKMFIQQKAEEKQMLVK